MPPKKNGAPARAGQPATRKPAARKAGGPSPKHRGYRPAEGDAGSAKKPRWSADERSARGRSEQRPRGGEPRDARGLADRGSASRPQRERAADSAERRDQVERGRSSRPNWEPRSGSSRFERAQGRGDGPARRDERARFDRGDRAPRREWERDERAPRRERDERAPRRDRDERAPRRDRDERPARRWNDGAGAPHPRADRLAGDRSAPRRDDRSARRVDAPRPAPVDDVVLERLEAEAIEATDVEGTGFGDLGLGQNIVRELEELGASQPFAIQAATIPQVLAGRDVLGRGRTGSGKTIAFGAPLVENLLREQAGSTERRKYGRAPRALILAPTRELALQIDRTVQPIARSVGLFTTQIYGGVPYARQLGALDRGVDIVIGTPGRVGDLAAQGKLDLSNIAITVLDEADHMCELGFAEPVQEILDRTPERGQRLLFSATLDRGVAEIVEKYLREPSVHEVAGETAQHADITHRVLLLDQRDKIDVLAELCSGEGRVLVFARTRSFTEQLADALDDAGVDADAIHGDLTQSRRQRALERFANGRTRVLVATDVAARGIHVDDVDLVVQADAPDEYKSYLHRSGRTGRAGRAGTVVTLVPKNRRRKMEDLLGRAEVEAEWTSARPGDAVLRELAEGSLPA